MSTSKAYTRLHQIIAESANGRSEMTGSHPGGFTHAKPSRQRERFMQTLFA